MDDAAPAPTPERCAECRFDAATYTWDDLMGSLLAIAPWFRLSVEGIDSTILNSRPAPTTWSPLEYARHVRGVLFVWRAVVTMSLEGGHPPVEGGGGFNGADAHDRVPVLDPARAHDLIAAEAYELHQLVRTLDAGSRRRGTVVNGEAPDIEWQVAHAVHDCMHHMADIGRGIAALGAGTPSQVGTLTHIHRSGGGLPKRPIANATIGLRGVDGDRQGDRRNHGRVWQALCLWSNEVIDALVAEGHPMVPGAAGENLTVSGVDWSTLRPGTRIAIGDEVLVELTPWAIPCHKQNANFDSGDFRRIDHDRHPGWARAYAKVLRDGAVSPGDAVVVEPASP